MNTTKSRAARLVFPVALVVFGIVGAGMTIANAGNLGGFNAAGFGMMSQDRNFFAPGSGGMMNRNGMGGGSMMNGSGRASLCTPAASSGQVVRFRAMDSGRMMGGAMMRLMPIAQSARAGAVTLELDNLGTKPHELLVYRLAAGAQPGQRALLDTDRISESGMLAEVEPVCTQPANLDGVAAGNVALVTLTLAAGRYEVVCNLPGHYRAGMWATLVVQ